MPLPLKPPHPEKALHHVRVLVVALTLMVTGSSIAIFEPFHTFGVGHLPHDVLAYFLHGVGVLPLEPYIGPIVSLLAGE